MANTKKFPKQIFVLWGGDDEPYLDANKTPNGIEDGERVAIYQLVEVKTQKVTQELV